MAALAIRKLCKSYAPGKPVLRDISLDLGAQDIAAVVGSSGAGKSTLIRCINRLVEPDSGEIRFEGQDLLRLDRRGLRLARRHIGMVFQEYNLVERLTVMENLLCGRLGYVSPLQAWLRQYPRQDIARAFELLDLVGLADFVNQRADSLSGGQRQRVGIARALMQQPTLLLADEPTSSLDPKTSVEIMTLLRELCRERGIPLLVNMHDVALARRFASRVIGLAQGTVVYDGAPAELSEAQLTHIFGGRGWLQE